MEILTVPRTGPVRARPARDTLRPDRHEAADLRPAGATTGSMIESMVPDRIAINTD